MKKLTNIIVVLIVSITILINIMPINAKGTNIINYEQGSGEVGEPIGTEIPVEEPEVTPEPTVLPTVEPTSEPTVEPSIEPTVTPEPSVEPSVESTTLPDIMVDDIKLENRNIINNNQKTLTDFEIIDDTIIKYNGTSETVIIPDGIKTIGASAFSGNQNIVKVVLPEGLTIIKSHAFSFCPNLTSIAMVDSITEIGDYAFDNDTNLVDFRLPVNLIKIGHNAFRKTGIQEIHIPKNAKYDKINVLMWEDNGPFDGSKVKKITFEEGRKEIQDTFFARMYDLEVIELPESLEKINDGAFLDSHSLIELKCNKNLKEIGVWAFKDSNISRLEFNEGLIKIDYYAFRNCKNLTKVKLPTTIEGISSSFQNAGITEINIPKGLKTADSAFSECKNLRSIKIEEGMEILPRSIFNNLSSLESITLPESIKVIGDSSFSNCINLTSIKMGENVQTIEGSVFANCTNLKTIKLNDGITNIGPASFYNCDSLENINIPSTVTKVGDKAFYGSDKLKSITIPDSVTSLGELAFANCSSLSDVYLSKNLTTIKEQTFKNCTSLKKLEFPSSLKTIEKGVFSGASNLEELHIPVTTTSISTEDLMPFPEKLTIYGVSGSEAENFARKIGASFVDSENMDNNVTTLQYLAMSMISYKDIPESFIGSSVKTFVENDSSFDKNMWDNYSVIGNNYRQFYINTIGDFIIEEEYLIDGPLILGGGIYAVGFYNPKSNESVLAFRGSDSLTSSAALDDWVSNIKYGVFDNISEQFDTAFLAYGMYKGLCKEKGYKIPTVTGHSLGGGLVDLVSVHYGVKGVAFDASPTLDSGYFNMYNELGESFKGTENWDYMEVTNEHDPIGLYMAEWSYRNVTRLKNLYKTSNPFDIFKYHKLEHLFSSSPHSDGRVEYKTSDVVGVNNFSNYKNSWINGKSMSSILGGMLGKKLFLGTTQIDKLNNNIKALNDVIYGGYSNDLIYGHYGDDVLIGGKGDDFIDGGTGNDKYYYWIGDGKDEIVDCMGKNSIIVMGLSYNDNLKAVDNGNSINILINGEVCITISKMISTTTLVYNGEESEPIEIKSGIEKKLKIATFKCPTDVEIYDPNGNLLLVLRDGEEMEEYNNFGNFYVVETETGEYGKYFEMIDECDFKVVPTNQGKMDAVIFSEDEESYLIKENIDINVGEVYVESDDGTSLVKQVDGANVENIELKKVIINDEKEYSVVGTNNSMIRVGIYDKNLNIEDIKSDIVLEDPKDKITLNIYTPDEEKKINYKLLNLEKGNYKLCVYQKGSVMSIIDIEINEDMNIEPIELKMLGDINGTNTVTITDLILMRKHILKSKLLNEEEIEIADININGTVTISDLIQLRQRILKRRDETYTLTN